MYLILLHIATLLKQQDLKVVITIVDVKCSNFSCYKWNNCVCL